MPTETGTAFLVDPMGAAPEALSESEFQRLRNYIDIVRNDEARELERAISWLFYLGIDSKIHPNPAMDRREIVGHIIHHWLSEVDDEPGGLLSNRFGRDIEILSDHECEILRSTLATVRAGGWFPRWLAVQCGIRADASQHPDDRFASPLRVAGSLVDDVKEFEASLETARDFARMRPDLLFPAQPPAVVPEPPAAEETSVGAHTNKPAKAHGTRKPRKKVAHA
jgi:hypothetical protein